jgi:flagellin
MALSIHTNYSSLVTQTNLGKTNSALGTNQQRLGTGFRINSAADDAAGLQIATRLNAQSRGMEVAIRNTGDAISMLQTAEGAFNEMTDILQRMKDLSTQAANGTNNVAKDLVSIQSEYDQLGVEIANIMDNTTYAGDKLFSKAAAGKFGAAVTFQIGATTAEKLTLNLKDVSGVDVYQDLVDALDGISATFTAGNADAAGAEVSSIAGASTNIDKVATALDAIGTVRAQFGATINRLNHTANNLANMKDNTDIAKGRMMDADFAKESATMTKNSMLMQSGISMLKQAGQMPGMVMSLLG